MYDVFFSPRFASRNEVRSNTSPSRPRFHNLKSQEYHLRNSCKLQLPQRREMKKSITSFTFLLQSLIHFIFTIHQNILLFLIEQSNPPCSQSSNIFYFFIYKNITEISYFFNHQIRCFFFSFINSFFFFFFSLFTHQSTLFLLPLFDLYRSFLSPMKTSFQTIRSPSVHLAPSNLPNSTCTLRNCYTAPLQPRIVQKIQNNNIQFELKQNTKKRENW